MTRTKNATLKYTAYVACVIVLGYGLLAYHNVSSELSKAESKIQRQNQQYDSISAQLQVIYEHKNKLETSLQQEKTDHRKTRQDLTDRVSRVDKQNDEEKRTLLSRIDSLTETNKMYKSQMEDQQVSYDNLVEEMNEKEHNCEEATVQLKDKLLVLGQEKSNELAVLNDKVANLGRDVMQKQQLIDDSQVQMQYLQNQVVQCQQQFQDQQAVYQQQQQQQQPQYFQQQQQQQQQQPMQQQAQQNSQFFMPAKQHLNLRNEFQKLKSDTLQFNPQQNEELQLDKRQRMPLYPSENDMQQFKNSYDGPKKEKMVPEAEKQQQMQINKPDDKPGYYKPKLPDVDDLPPHHADVPKADERVGQVVNEQVVPPKPHHIDDEEDDRAREVDEVAEKDDADFNEDDQRRPDYPADDDNYNVLGGNDNDAVEDGLEALAKPDMDDMMMEKDKNDENEMEADANGDDAQELENSEEELAARENRQKMVLKLKGQINNDGVFRRSEEADERAAEELEHHLQDDQQQPRQIEQPVNNNIDIADQGQDNLYEADDQEREDEYDNDGNVPQVDEIEDEDPFINVKEQDLDENEDDEQQFNNEDNFNP